MQFFHFSKPVTSFWNGTFVMHNVFLIRTPFRQYILSNSESDKSMVEEKNSQKVDPTSYHIKGIYVLFFTYFLKNKFYFTALTPQFKEQERSHQNI